ncbi:YaaA family protein [Agromyces sp. ZXT2-6]|uniref:YaaA family protein n=1 Tax=Agromyces sp. ZXT2-6 TaxID=3461153 RepID=UPI004054C081
MLVLLPPSETKRDGGTLGPLELEGLAFEGLTEPRRVVVSATRDLARDAEAMMRALKLGPRQAAEIDRNRTLLESPTMPAIDRYTGVLFDALDPSSLDDTAREFAGGHVAVHSALLGLVRGLDAVPAYRLSHDSRLPGLRLKSVWRDPVSSALAQQDGLVVDLRSEGYVDLGPAPSRVDVVYVRVVSIGDDGRRRALNHFNKRAKGLLTRALVTQRPLLRSRQDLIDWARDAGFVLGPGSADSAHPVELELVA